jgi:acyl-CoA synthetase (AMP-forming)/AMP-acid ligase II
MSDLRSLGSATLLELLRSRAETEAGRRLYLQLGDRGREESSITFDGLELKSRQIAASIQAQASAGERAVLLYPPGIDYIAGLFGAICAGVIAVPAYPPDPSRLERTLPRLRAIIRDSQAKVVLTTAAIKSMATFMMQQAPDLQALQWIATDQISDGAEANWRDPQLRGSDLAVLQYTSGSTGIPKGVMLRHDNLIENLRLIIRLFDLNRESVEVCWLPPYHDMGLIGGILAALGAAFPSILMPPLTFLKQPQLWLQAISRYRGTHCGGPNFGYELCVKKISAEEKAALDLSSWRVAFCGAEPINPRMVERFARELEPHGFARNAFLPCYGLAEATLLVACKPHDTAPILRSMVAAELEQGRAEPVARETPGARALVSCGRTGEDHAVVIVDPATCVRCAPGIVGEVWVSGPSVASGYWQREQESATTFAARLSPGGEGPYLRTGDLGFESEDELFIVGRLKDLIIIWK